MSTPTTYPRTLVPYDDITSPQDIPPATSQVSHHNATQPPSKKRKRPAKSKSKHKAKHWDEPGNLEKSTGYVEESEEARDPEAEEEESRELTHEEIWDDSVLIEAWNAAAEEYEAYHGPEKHWKKEPIHKSPLWYNSSDHASKSKDQDQITGTKTLAVNGLEPDSQPLDFETFAPTHDPSLNLPHLLQPPPFPGPDYSSLYLPNPPGSILSQSEAFVRATGAFYWAGYWTAIYHSQSSKASNHPVSEESEEQDNAEMRSRSDGEDLTTTQRQENDG